MNDICASNLIFFRGKKEKETHFQKNAEVCWLVHMLILKIVQPKLIIAFSNHENKSTYSYLREKFGAKDDDKPPKANHGTYKLKGFSCQLNSEPCYVAGLPHLSWYDPGNGGNALTDWLSSKLK